MQNLDLVIVRLDALNCGAAAAFSQIGLPALHADTLVTFSSDLRAQPGALEPTFELRNATKNDRSGIEKLFYAAFAGYPNHYGANPLLDPGLAIAGYVEWAMQHVGADGKLCWAACIDGQIAGLACTSIDRQNGECVGNLHAVLPSYAKRGIYTALIRATLQYCTAHAHKRLQISTQVGNIKVQRVWAKLGFVPEQAQHTYHLLPLFAKAGGAAPERHAVADAAALQSSLLALHHRSSVQPLSIWPMVPSELPAEMDFFRHDALRRDGERWRVILAKDLDGKLLAAAHCEHLI